ncbi:hypothetical protein H9P43_009550 [Blastocladiella emersonii ATCC 22665]|nr:hypothetical protein H9P43_009550 [Blastocladiella emersonii ATCC 22665]
MRASKIVLALAAIVAFATTSALAAPTSATPATTVSDNDVANPLELCDLAKCYKACAPQCKQGHDQCLECRDLCDERCGGM